MGELKAIEAGYPTNVKWCCNKMFQKWLETDTTPSWGKLFDVISSPAVYEGSNEGNSSLHAYYMSYLYACSSEL